MQAVSSWKYRTSFQMYTFFNRYSHIRNVVCEIQVQNQHNEVLQQEKQLSINLVLTKPQPSKCYKHLAQWNQYKQTKQIGRYHLTIVWCNKAMTNHKVKHNQGTVWFKFICCYFLLHLLQQRIKTFKLCGCSPLGLFRTNRNTQ